MVFRRFVCSWVACRCCKIYHLRCLMQASTVAFVGTSVAQVLFKRTYISEPLVYSRLWFTERTHSYLVLWISTRLLLGELCVYRYTMACVVRIIQRMVDFVINRYCRVPTLIVEGARNTPSARPLWLKEPGILMLLTVYKLITYRHHMNRTWAAPSIPTSDVFNIYYLESLCLLVTRSPTLFSFLVSESAIR